MKPTFLLLATLSIGCGSFSPSPQFIPPAPSSTSIPVNQVRLGKLLTYAPAASGFGYPRSEPDLANDLQNLDQPAMRRHAWSIWSALTAPTASGVPVMLSWYQNAEVFGDGTIPNPRVFLPQFLSGPKDTLGLGNPPIQFNTYNQSYRDHVRSHQYQWRSTLRDLVGQADNVVDFPAEAVAVKTVWWPVRHDGLTAFPVWDEQPTRPIHWGTGVGLLVDQGYFGPLRSDQQSELKSHERDGNEWGTFQRVVAIDPSSDLPDDKVVPLEFFDPADLSYQRSASRPARVVPLNQFFYLQANDANTVDKINQGLMGQLTRRFWGRAFTEEDYLALVAVHLTTREAPDWVWTTFWWHDQPFEAPYGHDRPPMASPFDHYPMEVAQSADVPLAADAGPHIAYNPYLEAGFALGTQSNCLACHQKASWTPEGGQEVYPVRRGSLPPGDPFFKGILQTHLLWSLVFRPRNQVAAPARLHDLGRGALPEP